MTLMIWNALHGVLHMNTAHGPGEIMGPVGTDPVFQHFSTSAGTGRWESSHATATEGPPERAAEAARQLG